MLSRASEIPPSLQRKMSLRPNVTNRLESLSEAIACGLSGRILEGSWPPQWSNLSVETVQNESSISLQVDLEVDTCLTVRFSPGNLNTMSSDRLAAAADVFVESIAQAWLVKRSIMTATRAIRDAAQEAVTKAALNPNVRIISVRPEISPLVDTLSQLRVIDPVFTIAYSGLGDRLQDDVWHLQAFNVDQISDGMRSKLDAQSRRHERAKAVEAISASGIMDVVALAVVDALTDNRADTLKLLMRTGDTGRIGTKYPAYALRWNDGVIRARLWLTDKITWYGKCLEIADVLLLQTVLEVLPGQPLNVVLDHPLLPNDLKIASVENRWDMLVLELDPPLVYFDADTGRTWK